MKIESPTNKSLHIVLFQMEQHGKALMILVYKLGDFSEAERFCELHSKVKKSQRVLYQNVSVLSLRALLPGYFCSL